MHVQPYQPGTMSRQGKPWSRVSGSPFMRTASSARDKSSRVKIQLAPGADVLDGVTSSSTPETSTRYEAADGFTWVALRPRTNRSFVIPRYGRGASEDEAMESAAGRYRVEQIGTDNARKPDQPLP